MAQAKTWALADFTDLEALVLQIGEDKLQVVHFSGSWALNEIPRAQCIVAVGRNARDVDEKAQIHNIAAKLTRMTECRVIFRPKGEYHPDGTLWPEGPETIFLGKVMGVGFRKMNGKIMAVVSLIHWLSALAHSSTLSLQSHPSNPWQLNAQAVLQGNTGAEPTLGGALGVMVSTVVNRADLAAALDQDLWGAVKGIFCALAHTESIAPGSCARLANEANVFKNTKAIEALSRIEGVLDDPNNTTNTAVCNLDYKYGVPLTLAIGNLGPVRDRIATSILEDTILSYASTTFWDKMMSAILPTFVMSLVPLVESAIVIADVPTLRDKVWRTIETTEWDSVDMDLAVNYPLRGVGVLANDHNATVAGPLGDKIDFNINAGGCFMAPLDELGATDGIIKYIPPPFWLKNIDSAVGDPQINAGTKENKPTKTETSPGAGPPPLTPGEVATRTEAVGIARDLYNAYAHAIYAITALSGRSSTLSGKLRFDIAPGSNVLIRAKTEAHIGGEDDLAMDMVGQVVRVQIEIDAEASYASTSFQLTHLRTLAENKSERTSVTGHPLFGTSIHGGGKHGAPLVAAYEFAAEELPEDSEVKESS